MERCLDYVNWIRSDPNIQLLESLFQFFFELRKELHCVEFIRDVNKNANQIVAKLLSMI